jgi:hypothetical protein
MNWDAIGAIAELIGAAAVFISLLYLAVQIRDSKKSDQIIAAAQAASAVDQWIGQFVRDAELCDLYRRGATDYESLSHEEKNRFGWLIVQFIRSVETIWLHHRIGAIDPGYWSSIEVTARRIVGTIGGLRTFERNRELVSHEFSKVMENILHHEKGKQKKTGE